MHLQRNEALHGGRVVSWQHASGPCRATSELEVHARRYGSQSIGRKRTGFTVLRWPAEPPIAWGDGPESGAKNGPDREMAIRDLNSSLLGHDSKTWPSGHLKTMPPRRRYMIVTLRVTAWFRKSTREISFFCGFSLFAAHPELSFPYPGVSWGVPMRVATPFPNPSGGLE